MATVSWSAVSYESASCESATFIGAQLVSSEPHLYLVSRKETMYPVRCPRDLVCIYS
jgi:hypothetical protein